MTRGAVNAKGQMTKLKGQTNDKCQNPKDKQNPKIKVQMSNEGQMTKKVGRLEIRDSWRFVEIHWRYIEIRWGDWGQEAGARSQ
jgi:hypothetical protein